LDDKKSEQSIGSDYKNSQNSKQDLEGYETDLKKKLIPVDFTLGVQKKLKSKIAKFDPVTVKD
jgi:hypothetical protein